jgi:hypothetical protein
MGLEDLLDIPHHFICPISKQLMKRPVQAPDGKIYDEKYLRTKLFSSPCAPQQFKASSTRDTTGGFDRPPLTAFQLKASLSSSAAPSLDFLPSSLGHVELVYAKAVHKAITKYCLSTVEAISKTSLRGLSDEALDHSMEQVCALLEYLKPSLYRKLYRGLLISLATEYRSAFSFCSVYSHTRSLNKLKVLRTLTADKQTCQVLTEFLVLALSAQGDLGGALRELNSIEEIEADSSPVNAVPAVVTLQKWMASQDMTQYSQGTLLRLLETARLRNQNEVEMAIVVCMMRRSADLGTAWQYLKVLLEAKQYGPEVRGYLLEHAEELLDLPDSPIDLLNWLLLEERQYDTLAKLCKKLQPARTLAAIADPNEIEHIMSLPAFPPECVLEMKVAKGQALIRRGLPEQGFQEFPDLAESPMEVAEPLKARIKECAFQFKQFRAYAAHSSLTELQEVLQASLNSLTMAESKELNWRRQLAQLHK